MGNLFVQCELPYYSGLPRDVAVTTWAFWAPGTPATELFDFWAPKIESFWNDSASDTPVGLYIAPIVDRGPDACRLTAYEVESPSVPALGNPIGEYKFTLALNADDNSLPLEVAVCNSFIGTGSPGIPLRRRRGRNYIGPLVASAVTTDELLTDRKPVVTPSLLDAIRDGAKGLSDELETGSGSHGAWCVWSRSVGAFLPILTGWVDNEFDTMRSRQVKATDRFTWVSAAVP